MEEGGDESSVQPVVKPLNTEAAVADNPAGTLGTVTDNLIDLSIEEDKSKTDETDQSSAKTEQKTEAPNPEEKPVVEERLCGWLQLRSRGLGNLNRSRPRWFLYVEDNCKLYIYREPSDLVPLGEICIATASFFFDSGHTEKPGLFKIKSDGKEYQIDAGSRQAMASWLQRLQHKRREFNIAKSTTVTNPGMSTSKMPASQFSGLISKDAADSPKVDRKLSDLSSGLLEYPEIEIKVPGASLATSTSSVNSAGSGGGGGSGGVIGGLGAAGSSSVRALNNLKSEVQLAISKNIKKPVKSPREEEVSQFYCEHPDDQDRMSTSTLSTTSINSDDGQTLFSPTSSSATPDSSTMKPQPHSSELTVTANKNRASSFETSIGRLNPFDKEFLLRQRSNTSGSAPLKPSQGTLQKEEQRRTGSWTVISKNDVPSSEAKEVIEQKGLKKTPSNSMFYTEMEESEESTDTTQRDTQTTQRDTQTIQRDTQISSTQANQHEEGKAKLLVTNTLSTLKKIKFGKRQTSESVSQEKSLPKTAQVCPKCRTLVPVMSPVPVQTPSQDVPDGRLGGANNNAGVEMRTKLDVEEELKAHKEIIILLQNKLAEMPVSVMSPAPVQTSPDTADGGLGGANNNGGVEMRTKLDVEEELKAHKEIIILLQNKLAELPVSVVSPVPVQTPSQDVPDGGPGGANNNGGVEMRTKLDVEEELKAHKEIIILLQNKLAEMPVSVMSPVPVQTPSQDVPDGGLGGANNNGGVEMRTKLDVEEELKAHKEIIILLQNKLAEMLVPVMSPVPVQTPSQDVPDGGLGGANNNGGVEMRTKLDVEEELKAHKEIIILLQNKLAEMVKEERTRREMASTADEDKSSIIVEKTKLIEDLCLQLTDIRNENKSLIAKVESLTIELHSTSDQENMYNDMLKVKDQMIMDLTNQVYSHEQQGQRSDSFDQSETPSPQVMRESVASLRSEKSFDEKKEFERLRDMCQGYEVQLKLMTKEILEMQELRKMDQVREKELEVKLATTNASYCQVKSKYLVLLKHQKEQAPLREGAEDQDLVNQLLQDAMEPDTSDIDLALMGSGQQYDKYGFSKKHYMDEFEEMEELDPLSNKAAILERQSAEISTKVRDADQEASLRVKWENYMAGKESKLRRSPELKALIRQGVPHEYREKVWMGCINLYISGVREEKGPEFYNNLLQAKATATGSDPAIKQIELDLLRTLPNNKHYESIDCPGIVRLRRVLLAFSEYNRRIGYCQGLNRLAAIALLFLSEEDAFWTLVAIADHILPPEYFSTTLMAAQADQRVLKDLVQDKLPKVHAALETHGVDLSLFTFNWFLTVFVDGVPTETFLRIWDTFLYEGSKVLFRFAIAFLKMSETEILQQHDGLQLNRYLRRIGDNMTNVKQIAAYAFNWINPFPMGKVATRRQQHLADIRVELQELDKLRHGMKVDRAQSQHNDYMSDDDLDS